MNLSTAWIDSSVAAIVELLASMDIKLKCMFRISCRRVANGMLMGGDRDDQSKQV